MTARHKHLLALLLAFAAGTIASPRTWTNPPALLVSWTTVLVVSVWVLLTAAAALLDSTRDGEHAADPATCEHRWGEVYYAGSDPTSIGSVADPGRWRCTRCGQIGATLH